MNYPPSAEIAAAQPPRGERADVAIVCEVRQGTRPWRLVRLEDLSPGGFRVAWIAEVSQELPLRIRIPGLQMLSAHVRWACQGAIGCEFIDPLHIAVFEHIVRHANNR